MRARNIKPGFWTNEVLGGLPDSTRLLFAGLWCLADREGKLEDRPDRIRHQLFGYQNSPPNVDAELSRLESLGFLTRYGNQSGTFILINNFRKHQSPHHTEKASKIADPKQKKCLTVNSPLDSRHSRKDNGECRSDSLNPDSLNPRDKDREEKNTGAVAPGAFKSASASPPSTPHAALVVSFQTLYQAQTGQPFKADKADFVLASRLLKDYGTPAVLEKARILSQLCRDRTAWYTKSGWADFSLKTLSRHWNAIIPEAIKPTKDEEFLADLRRQEAITEELHERLNSTADGD